MDVNDNAGNLMPRGVPATIASNRASTGCSYRNRVQPRPLFFSDTWSFSVQKSYNTPSPNNPPVTR